MVSKMLHPPFARAQNTAVELVQSYGHLFSITAIVISFVDQLPVYEVNSHSMVFDPQSKLITYSTVTCANNLFVFFIHSLALAVSRGCICCAVSIVLIIDYNVSL